MTGNRDDWELLSAYADGELAPEDAARLERRLAIEPDLVAGLARITALKSSLSALRPTSRLAVDKGYQSLKPARYRQLAVAGVLLLVASGLGYGLVGPGETGAQGIGVIHDGFSEKTYVVDLERRVEVSAGAAIGDLLAPDLSPSNLTLVDVRGFAGSPRIALHYRGRRGCRVTLVADRADSAPFESPNAAALIYLWQTPTRRFALIADGMDEHRFAAIGAFAKAQTRASEREMEFRTALVERTERARPCA